MKQVVSLLTMLVLTFASMTVFSEGQSASQQATSTASVVGKININSADADALADALHQIGEKKAAAIVEWRNANGPFTSKEQLMEVKGIGEATLKANADKFVL
ncbi:MAG: ComEA family DNA-binding protein [Cellvibrionaceae bacterium]